MSVLPISFFNNESILVVAPHPDDECIGVGGLLSLYPQLCDIVVLSDGCHGANGVLPLKERAIRRKQFEDEMHYLKPRSYQWIGHEDGTLIEHPDMFDFIDFSSYTKIFLPWFDDNHLDHTATFIYAMKRIKQQSNVQAEIYQYEVHGPFHEPTHILDITNVIDEKEKLIQFHQDQIRILPYDTMMMALGKYRSGQCGFPNGYMEAYLAVDISMDDSTQSFLKREKELKKFQCFYDFMVSWMHLVQEGMGIAQYLSRYGFSNVSIYGYAEIGKLLYRELYDSGVNVIDVFDRRKINDPSNVDVIRPEDGDTSVDLVIVTPIYSFDEIKKELSQMNYMKIVSLETIVRSMCFE